MFYVQYQSLFSLLSIVGISWQKENSTCKIVQRFIVHLTFVSTILILVFTSIFKKCSWDLYLENVTYGLAIAGVATGYYGILYQFYEMTQIVQQMEADWNELEDSGEIRIMLKHAKRCNFYTILLLYISGNVLVTSIFMSLLPIALDSFLPLNTTRERQIFFQWGSALNGYIIEIIIIEHVILTIFLLVGLSSYTFYTIIIQHVQCRFDIMGYKLQCAFLNDDGVRKSNRDQRLYRMVIQSIRYHTGTIGFVNLLNSTVHICYAIDVVLGICSVSVMSLHIFKINDEEENLQRRIRNLSLSACCVAYVFFNCYIGQEVLDCSLRVFNTAYSVPWYQASTKVQKMILFIMMRSNKPSCIQFGKIFASSLELFGRLAQTAVSYSMILHSTRK